MLGMIGIEPKWLYFNAGMIRLGWECKDQGYRLQNGTHGTGLGL